MSNNTQDMHICYAINGRYVDYCCISMVSVLENNSKHSVTFHILTDQLSTEEINKLKQYANRYHAEVYVYEADDSRLFGQKTSWSKYSWYRVFAGDLLPVSIQRILYLDCDVIVDSDISNLFKEGNLSGEEWSMAGTPDIMSIFPNLYSRVGYSQEKGYVCAGVLMMNLEYFRAHGLAEKILTFARENPERIHFPDQDALNIVCCDTKRVLPLKYGILEPFFRHKEFISKYKDEVRECLTDPRIVHYAGCNPWIAEYQHHFYADMFWKYVKLSGINIKKKHCCSGRSLLILRIKRMLALLGIKKYERFRLVRKPDIKKIHQLLDSI